MRGIMRIDFQRTLVTWLREQFDMLIQLQKPDRDPQDAAADVDCLEWRTATMLAALGHDDQVTAENLHHELAWLLGTSLREKSATHEQLIEVLASLLAAVADGGAITLEQARALVELAFERSRKGQIADAIARASKSAS